MTVIPKRLVLVYTMKT